MSILKLVKKVELIFVSKKISKVIKELTGCDINLDIQELEIMSGDEMAKIHISLDGFMKAEEYDKLLSKI